MYKLVKDIESGLEFVVEMIQEEEDFFMSLCREIEANEIEVKKEIELQHRAMKEMINSKREREIVEKRKEV